MQNSKLFHLGLALSGLLLAACAGPRAPGVPNYVVAVALSNDIATAINAHGDFVGFSGDTLRAFIYAGGVRTELGTLGGDTSFAFGINKAGAVAGEAALPDNSTHAFMSRFGVLRDLGTLGGALSTAFDINNAGMVVGTRPVTGV